MDRLAQQLLINLGCEYIDLPASFGRPSVGRERDFQLGYIQWFDSNSQFKFGLDERTFDPFRPAMTGPSPTPCWGEMRKILLGLKQGTPTTKAVNRQPSLHDNSSISSEDETLTGDLETFSEDDANEVIAFTTEFFQHVHVMPGTVGSPQKERVIQRSKGDKSESRK